MEINKINILGYSYFKLLFLFHIFIVAALFFYIGIARNKISPWFYNLMGILAIIIIVYHIYRIYTHGLKTVFWNYLHVIVIAPLLLYIAYAKNTTPRVIYDIFIGLGAAALAVNAYFMVAH